MDNFKINISAVRSPRFSPYSRQNSPRLHFSRFEFSVSKTGSYPYMLTKDVEAILRTTGHTLERLTIEEDENNVLIGQSVQRLSQAVVEYCTGLRTLKLMNVVGIPDDLDKIFANLKKLTLSKCMLLKPLGHYLRDSLLQQLTITNSTIDVQSVELLHLKHLKLKECIVIDLVLLLEQSPSLHELEVLDCQMFGNPITCESLRHVKRINLKTNDERMLFYLRNLVHLKNLRIQSELIIDNYLCELMSATQELELLTLDAFVSVQTIKTIIKAGCLDGLRFEGQFLPMFTDDHFMAVGRSNLRALEFQHLEPAMPHLLYVIETSPFLKCLKMGADKVDLEQMRQIIRESKKVVE